MTPSYWYSPVAAFLWQAALHSLLAGIAFYAWSRHLHLASGKAKRRILCVLLTVPLATAIVPGRNGFRFREQQAWLDSMRVLSIPLLDGIHIYHVLLGLAAVCALVSIWQEVVPVFRRLHADFDDIPDSLVQRVRALPNWERCQVGIVPEDGIFLATDGRPSRPRLMVSKGALTQLSEEELDTVLRHENAHWRRGRWWAAHVLFVVRMLQLHNPVALWAFREYSIEAEIDCDAEAVACRDPKLLARALLKVYQSTGRRDVPVRSTLRKRIDILLGRAARVDDDLPLSTVVLAALTLLLLLPWIV